jgi:hypothetical protein
MPQARPAILEGVDMAKNAIRCFSNILENIHRKGGEEIYLTKVRD